MGNNISKHKHRAKSLVELSRENLPKAVLLLAWPIIVEMLLQSTVGIADTAMVGRLSPAAIAAVGLGNQFIMFLLTVFAAIRTGVTVLVARQIGAEDYEGANSAARQALIVTAVFGGIVAVFGLIFPAAGYRLLGASEDVVAVGIGYMKWRSLAALFACIIMVVTGILRGCGDTFTAMRVNVSVNIINIVLNWILIFGNLGFTAMGTAGAGAATMVARLIGSLVMISVLFSGRVNVKLSKNDSYKPDISVLKRLFRIGIPAGIEQILMRGAQVFFTMIVTNLGTAMYAAHQIALRADSVAFMPGFGFSVAATALVGQNLGAGQTEEAGRAGRITMYMAVGFMSTIGLILFIFARPVAMFFTNDATVIAGAISAIRVISVVMPFMAIARVTAGALRGAGDTKYVMFGTGASIWIARLGLAYFLVRYADLGLVGAWIAMGFDNTCRAIIFLWRFVKGNWKSIKI